jgi:hypothetical protein
MELLWQDYLINTTPFLALEQPKYLLMDPT